MNVPAPMRKKSRTSVMRTKERSLRMPRSQVSRAMARQERPSRGLAGGPFVDAEERGHAKDELDEADGEEGEAPQLEARPPDGHHREAGDEAHRCA